MVIDRFERQERLFGKEGQNRIENAHVAIIGAGGLGSHVIQQLAFLGVGCLSIVDPEDLDETNLNRLIGARWDDPILGTKKVDIARRLVNSIDCSIKVNTVHDELMCKEAFSEIKKCNYVFGCLDNDGSRLVLNELCIAFEIPYFDLASDIITDDSLSYGGRVFVNFDSNGCLYCYDLISVQDASRELYSPEAQRDFEKIYGVSKDYLRGTGPSVVSVNGSIASLAVTEFMAMITGLRLPNRLLRYDGNRGIVNAPTDKPRDCYYCKSIRGTRENADVDRYYKAK